VFGQTLAFSFPGSVGALLVSALFLPSPLAITTGMAGTGNQLAIHNAGV